MGGLLFLCPLFEYKTLSLKGDKETEGAALVHWLVTHILPPWASIICFTTVSPRPRPLAL
jgi:hypothetical protein